MIDSKKLLADLKKLTASLVEDLRARTDEVDEVRTKVRGQYSEARQAGRTDRSYEEWREDLLAQVAVAWVLGTVFVRFCEDNELFATPLLSGVGDRRKLAGDHRADWLAQNRAAGDRDWLLEVFGRYRAVGATADLFGFHNPFWQFGPSDDGARAILELWRSINPQTGDLRYDFTDPSLNTRFLGDLYQDLSDHAKKVYALLQTPEFVQEFILSHTLDKAMKTFGLDGLRMIDPACGSGHFLLGALARVVDSWRRRDPAAPIRDLAQRALDTVNGVDVNAFAVAIARFRMLLATLQTCGISRLADAPRFRINVAVGDSLLHGRRSGELFSAVDSLRSLIDHRYQAEDAELANRLLDAGQYHVVVGNPPYVTPKDRALRDAYRTLYTTAYMQYSLSVPFAERFFDLAVAPDNGRAGGFVGMITTNTFMKRSFGKKLIESFFVTRDLTHVIDTSGAYIPGHGTPTVILFARMNRPEKATVRAVLGIRGEPARPAHASRGKVWSSIRELIGQPGSENEFISVEDTPRERLATHPWSLRGGAAPAVHRAIEQAKSMTLGDLSRSIGRTAHTGCDDAYFAPFGAWQRRNVGVAEIVPLVEGEAIRDWSVSASTSALFPYDAEMRPCLTTESSRVLWPLRSLLRARREPGGTHEEIGMTWYEWSRFHPERFETALGIPFAFVATQNHFALDRGGNVFNRSAPAIKLPESASVDDHLRLVGLLNSSTGCFWMKQVFHNKGSTVDNKGARQTTIPFENFWEHDGTKLKHFPIPKSPPLDRVRELEEAASTLAACLPDAVARGAVPSHEVMDAARHRAHEIRSRMVALQEELDWECYRAYGLIGEVLTTSSDRVPPLRKGLRAFEFVLARRAAAGEIETTWFVRHGSTPTTELPDGWPDDYKALVERRIELIESDRAIRLLERPEYKRRWNWEDWKDLVEVAVRDWLLDRLEATELWQDGKLLTTARLTDNLRTDGDFLEAARLFAGQIDVDLAELVRDLASDEAVPFAAVYRHTASGIRKRREWERVWDEQRAEDQIDSRTALPVDDPDYLTASEAEELKREQGLAAIPVPPKYNKKDFQSGTYWRLRGKLDVPKERFTMYPNTRIGADSTPVIGWAGWDQLSQARALAGHYTERKADGADQAELVSLLAGLQELVPWLKQWHNDLDPEHGQRMGDFVASFVESEARTHGKTVKDLKRWTPGNAEDDS